MCEEIEGCCEDVNENLKMFFLSSSRFVLKELERLNKGKIIVVEVIKLDMGLGNVKMVNLRVFNLLCFVCNFSNLMEVVNDINFDFNLLFDNKKYIFVLFLK